MNPSLNLEFFYYKIYSFFVGKINVFADCKSGFLATLSWIKVFAFIFSVLFVAGLVYNIIKLLKIRKKQLAEFVKVVVESSPGKRVSEWDEIQKYLDSENSSDWRIAILEADILLDSIIEKIGYKGSGLGERLIKIKPAQFRSLNQVWTAHKVRNRIAHEGPKYELTKDVAEKVLEMYKKALEELEYI